MESSVGTAVKELQLLVTSLSQDNLTLSDDFKLQEIGDRLLGLLEAFPRHNDTSHQMKGHLSSIHTAAVTLWNVAVAFRASGNTKKSFVAQLRHVSLGLVLLSEPVSPPVSHFKKLLAMSLKTARAWLDADNFVMADAAIVHGWEQTEKLLKCVGGDPEGFAIVSASKVRLLACKSEAWLGLSEQERALDCVGQVKQLLPHVSQSERAWVAVLCYNLGLDLYQQGAYSQCLSWLKESYEIGRHGVCIEATKQAKTLRLIAVAYLDSDSDADWLKALNTVELSLTEHLHPTGLMLKVRVLLRGREVSGGQEAQIRCSLLELIRCEDCGIDLCLSGVKLTADTPGLSELALTCLSTLKERHNSPHDTSKCVLLHLELLLASDRLEDSLQLLSGTTGTLVELDVSKRTVMVLWEHATRLVESDRHHQALLLYEHCLNRFSSASLGEGNLAKLHRNVSSCLLELGRFDESQSALQSAVRFGSVNPYTHYIGYKLALLQDNTSLAGEHLSSMISSYRPGEMSIAGLLSLAVQVAFESGNKLVACAALEELILSRRHETADTLSAIRCLVRLKLTLMEGGDEGEVTDTRRQVVGLISTAYEQLLARGSQEETDLSPEISWFSKVSWNLALQSQTDYSAMKDFFALSMRLNKLSLLDPSIQSRQRACLVGAAAAALRFLKTCVDEKEVRAVTEEVLGFVEQGKKLCVTDKFGQPEKSLESSLVFFHLFELEAKHRLGYQNLGRCLEDISLLPGADCKIFEAIGSITCEGNLSSKRLSVKALQLAIERHNNTSQGDTIKLAQLHHSLVSLLLSNDMLIDSAGKENALNTFKLILSVMDSKEGNGMQKYPEIDTVWLMTKSWNTGVIQYSKQSFVEAERWCGVSLKFLYKLEELKSSYESQMVSVYSEILTKLPDSCDGMLLQPDH